MLAVLVALLLQGPVSQPCPSALRSSNPGIVDLELINPNELLLIGASQGTTTLSFEQS